MANTDPGNPFTFLIQTVMKTASTFLPSLLWLVLSATTALAQTTPTDEHAGHHATISAIAPDTPVAPVTASTTPVGDGLTAGEVRKIDVPNGKITLRHGDIVNLDMPAMTMVFRVTDPQLLGALQPGDKVRFAADKIGGLLTVTRIDKVTP